MNRIILFFTLAFLTINLFAQDKEEFKPSGKLIGSVFQNYNYNFSAKVKQRSTFAVERAYIGYKYDFAKNISGKVTYDMEYNTTDKNYQSFLKTACIEWTVIPKLKLTMGMMGLNQFDTQEKNWGYRYIMKTHTDEYKMGASADLGFNAEYEINKMFTINAFVLNGEGYKALQDNLGNHKYGGNVVAKPIEGLTVKGYYSYTPCKHNYADTLIIDTAAISTMSFFIGYEMKDRFRVGVEYNALDNGKDYKKYAEDYQMSGYSAYATYIINSKFDVFARYDLAQSNKVHNATSAWNIASDGYLMLGGLQYKAAKGVNFALNYRHWVCAKDDTPLSGIYFNMGLNF
ncbi:MAG: hypothetical protein WCK02_03065 [Bacteroidota bacterium]